jgi:RNase P subunit RPR2
MHDHQQELCPLQYTCIVGQILSPVQTDPDGPVHGCPSYRGVVTLPEGFFAVDCALSEAPVVPCPVCKNPHMFKQRNTVLHNWLCKMCGFYVIPPDVRTHFERTGVVYELVCPTCGKHGWIIPDPDFSPDDITWQCEKCGTIHRVNEVTVNRKDKT